MWGGRFTERAVKSRVDAHLTEAFFCSRTSSRCTLGDDGGAFDVLLRGLGDPAASSSNVAALSSSSASSSGTSCISPSEPMSRGRLAPASPVLARGGVALEPIDVSFPDDWRECARRRWIENVLKWKRRERKQICEASLNQKHTRKPRWWVLRGGPGPAADPLTHPATEYKGNSCGSWSDAFPDPATARTGDCVQI